MAYIRLDGVSLRLPVYDGAMLRLSRLSSYRRAKVGSTAVSHCPNAGVSYALYNISLKDGDQVCLVGHNGAGKARLLRLLALELCRAIRARALHFLEGRLVFLGDIDEAFNRHTNMRRGAAA